MPSMLLRVLFLVAAAAAAVGGFCIGSSSYDLDQAAAFSDGPPPLPPLARR